MLHLTTNVRSRRNEATTIVNGPVGVVASTASRLPSVQGSETRRHGLVAVRVLPLCVAIRPVLLLVLATICRPISCA